jgi:hypothetical protein
MSVDVEEGVVFSQHAIDPGANPEFFIGRGGGGLTLRLFVIYV